MTFTDEDGTEFEADINKSTDSLFKDGYLVIRPKVKQEPKYEVNVFALAEFETGQEIQIFWKDKDQAQLIKEAVEACMKHITADKFDWRDTEQAIIKARQSMRENN